METVVLEDKNVTKIFHLMTKRGGHYYKSSPGIQSDLTIFRSRATTPLIRTEYRRLRDFFQHFHPKCNINWGFQLFWSAYKPKLKNNFFGSKPAVLSPFIGKLLGLEQNSISEILIEIKF